MNYEKTYDILSTIVKEGYEGSVALRALERAGRCKNLHGHVHELMFCDKYNLNPAHILRGEQANLTKSTTATMKDVIMTRGGKVIGHAQLKDTSSVSGALKTARQINAGKYGKTAVYGTEETAAKLLGKTQQTVHSSGISSETTSRVAQKALGKLPTTGAVQAAAMSGGTVGACLGAGIEAISSLNEWADGEKDFDDVVIDVGGAAFKGGISGAGSSAAGVLAAGATGSAISAITATGIGSAVAGTAIGAAAFAVAPVAIGFGAACAVGGFISSLFD